MKKIRIGNDILIRWRIMRNGYPEDFTGRTVSVRLEDCYGTPFPVTEQRDGNVFSITFAGSVQERLGEYTLVLVENDGEEGMVTLDHVRAFKLVPHSYLTGGEDCCPDLRTESVSMVSEINLSGPSDCYQKHEVDALVDGVSESLGAEINANATAIGTLNAGEETEGSVLHAVAGKQDRHDDTLETEDKEVAGAINEVRGMTADITVSGDTLHIARLRP